MVLRGMRTMAKGEGKAGCIFWGLLVVVVAFLAFKVVPLQIAKMQLEDTMKEMAMAGARKNSQWFENEIMARAKNLDIPLERKNVKVQKSSRRVVMDVEWTVVLDLIVTDYPLQMSIHLDREIFLM